MLAYEGLTAFTWRPGFWACSCLTQSGAALGAFRLGGAGGVGTLLNFWILVTNSWMQTPGGYKLVDGIFYPTSWMEIIFSASFPYRFLHTVSAFYVTTGFVVLGVTAVLLRNGKSREEARLMLSMTLSFLTLMVPLQIFLGDLQGLNTLHHQPAKLAAIEAHWDREARAPLALFAIPDQQAETNHYAIEVPLLGSLILTHDVNGVVPVEGLPARRPGARHHSFFAFRTRSWTPVMLGLVVVGLAAGCAESS